MWFTPTETYVETIWSEAAPEDGKPGKGEQAAVTFRRLNAGDYADIQDTLRIELGEDSGDPTMALGTLRMLTVRKAVIDWTLPGPKPSPEALSQLSPHVFEQIYSHVKMGTDPTEEEETPLAQSEAPTQIVPRLAPPSVQPS